MFPLQVLTDHLPEIETRIGYSFQDKELLILAFVHRSFLNEHRELLSQHNERLEFLGDSVLGMLVADYLYHTFPEYSEGHLSTIKARLVEGTACNVYGEKLKLAPYILLGKGEKMNSSRGKTSIAADFFEALMGALYLDGGWEGVRGFFNRHCQEEVALFLQEPLSNWKADLQIYSQKKYGKPPLYKVVKESGPEHKKAFEVAVFLEETQWGQGKGFSKKEAEQEAAADALRKLEGGKDG